MGAWGALPFDNDEACDWAFGLDEVEDLTLVESTLASIEEVGDEYLEQELASSALAACEVLARLRGNTGYQNAYTENVDQWVANHPITPAPELVQRASDAIDRILGDASELRELWDDGDSTEWRDAVQDLRRRLTT
jgi:hypothetical protein